MGYRDVRVVMVTTDHLFYRQAERSLSIESRIESVSSVPSISLAQSMLSRTLCNALVIDVDTCPVLDAHIKQLSEKNKLLTVFTSLSPHKAAPLIHKQDKRAYVQKPRSLSDIYVRPFVRSVVDLMQAFYDSMPVLNYHDMSKTVDINQKIVVIASSTGGTDALSHILQAMPVNSAPILAVQHMPSGFTKFFAERMDKLCPIHVREAADNDYPQKGVALVAPADKHMRLVRRGSKLMTECFIGQKIHGVMPAADILFESVAPLMRANAIGVILTGMGADGARGLMLMHNMGAKTIGQDEATCVVYGMPKVAHDLGALDVQVPLDKIADTILSFL